MQFNNILHGTNDNISEEFLIFCFKCFGYQWRIQDFPNGGGHCFVANGGAHILFSGKKCMKLKEIGLKWGGGTRLLAPCYSKITIFLWIILNSIMKTSYFTYFENNLQGVKFLFFPIFSYFSQHTPIFPIFQQFPPIFLFFWPFLLLDTLNLLKRPPGLLGAMVLLQNCSFDT